MAITNSKKTDKEIHGVVTGCELLNVRARPNSNSDIVNVISAGAVVSVDSNTIGNKFFKIKMHRKRTRPLSDEVVEGYCMSDFIKIIDDRGNTMESEVTG